MALLEHKVALVTGAASGIGAATAARFAREGARIVGFDLAEPPAARWAMVAAACPDALFQRGDVRSEGDVAAAVAATIARFGQLDVLMNAAGVAGGGPVHMLPLEEWQRVIDVNLTGTFLACKHALLHMLERRTGSIVNVASIEGLEGMEGASCYNASKGGVVLLTKNMAIDYARRGIRVNCVCPGFVDTPMMAQVTALEGMAEIRARMVDAHQVGRVGRPEEIAAAAAFLASVEAAFVTGHSLVVDGGWTAGRRFGVSKMLGLE